MLHLYQHRHQSQGAIGTPEAFTGKPIGCMENFNSCRLLSLTGIRSLETAMSVIDTTEAPVLAAPRRPEGRVSSGRFLAGHPRQRPRDATHPRISTRISLPAALLWRRTFIVNEPGGVRHVLLDNAQNYRSRSSAAASWSRASAAACSPARARRGAAIAASWRRRSIRAASPATRRS